MTELRTHEWLEDSLAALDRVYFDDRLAHVQIGWMKWRPRKKTFYWGFCYTSEKPPRIEVNRLLARVDVPAYVALETIYHELLHLVIGVDHDLAFTLAEKRFVHHGAASEWNAANFQWLCSLPKPF